MFSSFATDYHLHPTSMPPPSTTRIIESPPSINSVSPSSFCPVSVSQNDYPQQSSSTYPSPPTTLTPPSRVSSVLPDCQPSTSRARSKSIKVNKKLQPTICKWIDFNGQKCRATFEQGEHQKDLIQQLADHVKAFHTDQMSQHKNMCRWEKCTRQGEFKANYQLDLHLRKHTSYKPHECPVSNLKLIP